MNLSEVISSGLLESYVLGSTTAEETALINDLCRRHPELLAEIEAIEESLMNFSAQLGKAPSPGLKAKIAAQLKPGSVKSKKKEPARVVPIDSGDSGKLRLYKFCMAASLLLFVTSLVYNVLMQQRLSRMNSELVALNSAKSYMAEELKVQQTSISKMNSQMQVVFNPMVKTVALNGMNSLEKRSAMVHWNTETKEVYFNAAGLPASPEARQYQLWAIVDGKPVDAGVIELGGDTVFQKMKAIGGATAFAVTIEKMGGSPVPTMETMCFLGKV